MAAEAEERRRRERELERARRTVLGWLAPIILHETNNVLTVMAGVRQLMKAGATLSDRVGTMIDQQLERMEQLVTAIRRIGPADAFSEEAPRTLPAVAGAVDQILRLASKGRGITIEIAPLPDVVPEDGELLALGLLCVLMPRLPARSSGGAARISLRGDVRERSLCVALAIEGSNAGATEARDDEARALLAAGGGELEFGKEAAGVSARCSIPLSPR